MLTLPHRPLLLQPGSRNLPGPARQPPRFNESSIVEESEASRRWRGAQAALLAVGKHCCIGERCWELFDQLVPLPIVELELEQQGSGKEEGSKSGWDSKQNILSSIIIIDNDMITIVGRM